MIPSFCSLPFAAKIRRLVQETSTKLMSCNPIHLGFGIFIRLFVGFFYLWWYLFRPKVFQGCHLNYDISFI